MRIRVIALLAMAVVCLSAGIKAQVVNEEASSAELTEEGLMVSLAVENLGKEFQARLTMEILDNEGKVVSREFSDLRVREGRRNYSIPLPVPEVNPDDEDGIFWHRLRYRIGQAHGIVSLSELLKGVIEVTVIAPDEIRPGQIFKARVRTRAPFTKQPVPNANIRASLGIDIETDDDEDTLELLGSGITDEQGFAVLEFRIPEGIVIDYVEDLKIAVEKNGLVRTVEKNLSESEEEGNIFLTTDKPIYQPGQTFGVRALIFDTAKTVVTGEELEFAIYDEEDTLLFRETVESSEYGIASVSWAIPENAKLGTYRVEVEGDDDFNGGERTFKVTRYDLPNFAVTAKPDKPFYLPGDKEAVIEVSADYLFGKPVPDGHVKVVLESGRKWNWRNQAYDIEESQKLEGNTDPDGRFRARIDLTEETAELARANWRRFSDLHLAAYYTDLSTNRTEQRRFDIRVSKEPIHVYLMSRYYGIHSQLPITAYVSAFYADGRPAQTTVRMVGKENGRGDSSFAELARTDTNAYGAGRIVFTRPDFDSVSDDLDLKLTATDGSGAVGTFEDTIYFNDRPGITVSTGQAIRRPGEPIELDIRSTIKEGTVYVDVMRDWDAVANVDAVLKNGKANIVIPYDPAFSGALHIWAYTEYTDDGDLEVARANTVVIYPEQKNLLLDASFGAVTYKPGASADAVFSVKDGAGKPAQSALGVVIFDRAVEERARTDAEFGSYFGRFGDWLGLSQRFGGVTLKELNELNVAEPPAKDLQLAAEVLLASSGSRYFPQIERSEIEPTAPRYVFTKYFKTQFGPVESALNRQYEEDFDHPVDEASLVRILKTKGLDLRGLKDPWGQPYRSSFTVYRNRHLVAFKSAGADKKFGTRDDLTVSHMEFEYFPKIGNAIRKAAADMKSNLGSYIRDYGTLRDVLRGKGIDLDAARDPWGNPYVFIFDVSGRRYTIEVRSTGPDGKRETEYWRGDDFQLHYSAIDYFSETEQRITTILSEERNDDAWVFPETEAAFWEIAEKNGMPMGSILDGFGRPVFVTTYERWEYSDKETVSDGKLDIKPVTQKVRFIEIRSTGRDGIRNGEGYRSDDFTLATFSTVTIQRLRSQAKSRGVIRKISYTGSSGAISGKVTDQTGAVIPGAIVTVSREADGFSDAKATNASGIFLFENLSTGSYKLEATADGFQKMVYSDIRVKAYSLTEIDITLEIGGVSAMVEVQGAIETLNTSDAQITTSTTVERSEIPGTGVQMETPRLREYFPETLVWAPEVITDEQGRAELKFKMADNITTWKMYTVASTKNGKIGVSENEITAFQPFFADLEPPKFLTTGDEIHLPVQIRNYTPSEQPVNVTMDRADWFSFLGEKVQKIEVPSNASENAVFGFRAERAVDGGKQRVTAIAASDSDAIEKPVTVRPNGQEITETETRLFSDSAAFNANIPANAIGEGLDTRVRIYPNLLANVADSADGLLKRPYGCGEQTISSTYPNLMILKLAPEESRLRAKAEEFLRKGYERLLAYQVSSGGFTYWGSEGTEDLALTAYALRFLKDAAGTIDVDAAVIRKAENWLLSQQKSDGRWVVTNRWYTTEDLRQTRLTTSYVARSLAMSRVEAKEPTDLDRSLARALSYLKIRNAEIDEPYALALYGLASLDAGQKEEAESAAATLRKMAIPEGAAAYWKLETNTPFYGWGTAGRLETTALVVQLLAKLSKSGEERGAVDKGILFLLKNKDRYGVWYSTQTTINVLDAILATLERSTGEGERNAVIKVNGRAVRTLTLPPSNELAPVIETDVTEELANGANEIEVSISDDSTVMVQVVGTHYISWQDAVDGGLAEIGSGSNETVSRLLELDYACDKQSAKVMEEVSCSVRAERVGFRGYGMLLAEIGIPPGADVSRESLDKALSANWSVSRYDVLPDRIIVYMWAQPGGTRFDFSFRPRYGINAQTPASVVYDYYNDEARAVVAPLRFSVEEN